MSSWLQTLGAVFLAVTCGCSGAPRYHNPSSYASDPGGITLARHKLDLFRQELTSLPLGQQQSPRRVPDALLDEHLRLGDSRAAIVLSTQPALLVAAYTDELDCVVMLRFDPAVVQSSTLTEGSRLLTVNTYSRQTVASDLHPGPKNLQRYTNVFPLIAEFLSDDIERIAARKESITEEEWRRAWELGQTYLKEYGPVARFGNPYLSAIPAQR